MSEKKIKNTFWRKLQRKVRRFAPVAISTLFAWAPVNATRATSGTSGANTFNKVQKMGGDEKEDKIDSSSKLALVDFKNPNAYKDAIAQISINTEVNSDNPSAVATGNGYFGQHQFGGSANSGYMVRKYLAYALTYSSQEFRESLAKNLLVGTKANKDNVIDNFVASLDEYDAKGSPEKAYLPTNPAYKKLFSIMNISSLNFAKAHKDFGPEAGDRQKMFVYEIYLNLMPVSLKKIIKDYPQVKFGEVHPAVMGSIIAIAVKQGNGARLSAALSEAYYSEIQKRTDENWENNDSIPKKGKRPLAVVCKKSNLVAENAILIGKNILRIYDISGKIKNEDIITDENIRVVVFKANRPKEIKSSRPIITYSTKDTPISIGKIVNNRQWLKNYCSGFSKVYNEAEANLDKIPTLDTYLEMSIILNDPNLYNSMEKMHHNEIKEAVIAFTDEPSDKIAFQQRAATDRKKIMNMHNAELATIEVSPKHKRLQPKENTPTEQLIKKIINNNYRNS